jgi:hypothetical protein
VPTVSKQSRLHNPWPRSKNQPGSGCRNRQGPRDARGVRRRSGLVPARAFSNLYWLQAWTPPSALRAARTGLHHSSLTAIFGHGSVTQQGSPLWFGVAWSLVDEALPSPPCRNPQSGNVRPPHTHRWEAQTYICISRPVPGPVGRQFRPISSIRADLPQPPTAAAGPAFRVHRTNPPPRLGYLAREHILASPPSNGPPCGPDAVGRECRKNKTQINTEFNHEKAPGRFCSRQRTMNGDAGLVGCLVDRLTTRVRVISSSRGFPWIPSANGLPTTTHGS